MAKIARFAETYTREDRPWTDEDPLVWIEAVPGDYRDPATGEWVDVILCDCEDCRRERSGEQSAETPMRSVTCT